LVSHFCLAGERRSHGCSFGRDTSSRTRAILKTRRPGRASRMWTGTTQRRAALPPDSHEQHVSHTLGVARLGDSTLPAKSTAVCQQPCVRADAASRTSITACVTYIIFLGSLYTPTHRP